jgi:hypothetical protein
MKKLLKFEDFVFESETREYELILEAFNSSVLQKISSNSKGGVGKAFFDTLSKMGVAASEITNLDITELDPKDAHKHAKSNPNDILIYFSNEDKPNPYKGKESYGYANIQADIVLAVVKGKNWMGLKYDRWASKGGKAEYTLADANTNNVKTMGIGNYGGGKYDSGITSFAKIAEISDVVYVIDLNKIEARSTQLRLDRKTSKEGAIAFKDDKQFKQENMSRYEAILKERASNTDIDKVVSDAIDLLTTQIKDAIGKGAKTSYGEVLIGTDPKGREIRMSDAGSMMSNILSDYGRYASSMNDAEKSREQWKERDNYYEAQAKTYAKSITDRFKKIEDLNYAW